MAQGIAWALSNAATSLALLITAIYWAVLYGALNKCI